MRPIAALLLALLLAAQARAGTPEAPEAPDPGGDVPPGMDFADFLGVWLAASNGTLSLSWQVASMPQVVPGACYTLGFRAGGEEFMAEIIFDAQTQAYAGTVGPVDGAGNASRPVVTLGSPAIFRLAIPTGVLRAESGMLVELTDLRTCFASPQGPHIALPGTPEEAQGDPSSVDVAFAVRPFSVPYPPAPPPEKPTPAPVKPPATNTSTPVQPPAKAAANASANLTSSALAPTGQDSNTSTQGPPAEPDRGFLGIPSAGILAGLATLLAAAWTRRQR